MRVWPRVATRRELSVPPCQPVNGAPRERALIVAVSDLRGDKYNKDGYYSHYYETLA